MNARPRHAVGIFGLIAAAVVFLGGCGEPASVRILAASSLQDVLPAILDAYAATGEGVTFETQFGGSQALATNIELGADADVFISANEQQFARLEDAGLVNARTAIVTNRLVVAVRADSPIERFEDLGRSDVRVAIGAPDVPVGALTQQALGALDSSLADAIRANVVTEDPNVRVALSRVELGEADAAFVYRTDVIALEDIRAIEVPVELEPNIYVAGLLPGASDGSAALLEFLVSDATTSIWRAAGFEPVGAR